MENQTNPPQRIGNRAPQHFYIPSYEDQESFYSFNFKQRTMLLVIPGLECTHRHFLLLHYFHQHYNMDLKDRFFISFKIVSALCYAFRQGMSGVTSCLSNYLRNLGYRFDQSKSKRRKNSRDPYYYFRLSDQEAKTIRNKRLDDRKRRRLEKIQGLKKNQYSKPKAKANKRKACKKRSKEPKKKLKKIIKIKKKNTFGNQKTPNQQILEINRANKSHQNKKHKKNLKKIVVIKNHSRLKIKQELESVKKISPELLVEIKPENKRKRTNFNPNTENLGKHLKTKNTRTSSKQNIFLNMNNYYDDLSNINEISFSDNSSTDEDLQYYGITDNSDNNDDNIYPSNSLNIKKISADRLNDHNSNNSSSNSNLFFHKSYNNDNINFSQSNSFRIESNTSNDLKYNSGSFSRSNYSIYKEFVPSSLINKKTTNQIPEKNYLRKLSSFVSSQNIRSFDEKIVEFSSTEKYY
ncbi:hypothetical protein M0813_07793 [Anaeramoeba flamelloides]|uniref:Uncharacterized protein n=1 Tax=Anaeramoeba flamelloides TaxID=1746091 RepID=A0ABQ8XD56_9EUKA|nr:hypothetical protein M0813_07793 [Anaeramoeba flamelloides]